MVSSISFKCLVQVFVTIRLLLRAASFFLVTVKRLVRGEVSTIKEEDIEVFCVLVFSRMLETVTV